MKKLILVTSPPASGKTTLAKALAKAMRDTVYLDKDTLVPLSIKVFEAAGEPVNRSSEFFETHIRDVEYEVILDFAAEAIQFDSNVIINAPFSEEIRDKKYMEELRRRFEKLGALVCVIWISCSIETTHRRMKERDSSRDTWKLAHWDEYIKMENFNPPDLEGLLIYENDTPELAEKSFAELLEKLKSC
jgi:tRNA uridine 5-carbamoylmethylation protein Kti12